MSSEQKYIRAVQFKDGNTVTIGSDTFSDAWLFLDQIKNERHKDIVAVWVGDEKLKDGRPGVGDTRQGI